MKKILLCSVISIFSIYLSPVFAGDTDSEEKTKIQNLKIIFENGDLNPNDPYKPSPSLSSELIENLEEKKISWNKTDFILGNYSVQFGRLGYGDSGFVRIGQHIKTHHPVAIKIMEQTPPSNPHSLEFQRLKKLGRVYCAGSYTEILKDNSERLFHFLIMPVVDGEGLSGNPHLQETRLLKTSNDPLTFFPQENFIKGISLLESFFKEIQFVWQCEGMYHDPSGSNIMVTHTSPQIVFIDFHYLYDEPNKLFNEEPISELKIPRCYLDRIIPILCGDKWSPSGRLCLTINNLEEGCFVPFYMHSFLQTVFPQGKETKEVILKDLENALQNLKEEFLTHQSLKDLPLIKLKLDKSSLEATASKSNNI